MRSFRYNAVAAKLDHTSGCGSGCKYKHCCGEVSTAVLELALPHRGSPAAELERGRRLCEVGDLTGAGRVLQLLVLRKPPSLAEYNGFGEPRLTSRRPAEAIRSLKQAIALHTKMVIASYDLGTALEQHATTTRRSTLTDGQSPSPRSSPKLRGGSVVWCLLTGPFGPRPSNTTI